MADVEETSWNLAQLAGLDSTEVEEIRFSQLPAMLATFEVIECYLEKAEREVDEVTVTHPRAVIVRKVIDVDVITEKNFIGEAIPHSEVIGKNHTMNIWLDPADLSKGIGRLKAQIADSGAPNSGPIGGLKDGEDRPEGYVPGYMDAFVGVRHKARITKRKQGGREFVNFEPIAVKKAA